MSRFIQRFCRFLQGFSGFFHDNKVGILCFVFGISSINFAVAGNEKTIPSFAPFILDGVEAKEHFEEFILANKPAVEAHNQEDTTSQTAQQWIAEGKAAYDDALYGEAMEYFNKAINLDPNLAEAYFILGRIYAESEQDYDAAIKYYHKAIELDSNLAEAYIALAEVYQDGKHDYDEAIKWYKKAISSEPYSSDAYLALGLLYKYNKQDYDKAIECFDKMVELNFGLLEAYYSLGLAYQDGKQDYDKAAEYFDEVVELNPNYASVFYYLGILYEEQGNLEKAIECHKKAAILSDESSQDWLRDRNISW